MTGKIDTSSLFDDAISAASAIKSRTEVQLTFSDANNWILKVESPLVAFRVRSCRTAIIKPFCGRVGDAAVDALAEALDVGDFLTFERAADDGPLTFFGSTDHGTKIEIKDAGNGDLAKENRLIEIANLTPTFSFVAEREIAPFVVKNGATIYEYDDADSIEKSFAADDVNSFFVAFPSYFADAFNRLRFHFPAAFVNVGIDKASATLSGSDADALVVTAAQSIIFPASAPKYLVDVVFKHRVVARLRFADDAPGERVAQMTERYREIVKPGGGLRFIARDLNGLVIKDSDEEWGRRLADNKPFNQSATI